MIKNPYPFIKFGGFGNSKPNLYHIFTIGASQSGGGAGAYCATPARSVSPMTDVVTLTNGPLSPNTSSGVFIPLVEGDTYDQDISPQSTANIESQATSMGQQLKSYLNDNSKICVTVHYRGGTTLQNLSQGGTNAAEGYTQAIAAVARVKALSDGYNYVPIFIFVTSGTGVNPYETDLTTLISQVRAGVLPYYSGTLNVLLNQPRVTGSPDYGEQVYTICQSLSNVHLVLPYADTLLSSEIQADGIHLTNYGQGRMGVYNADFIYNLFKNNISTYLKVDLANISLSGDVITVPILNAAGALQLTGDGNFSFYDSTNSLTLAGTTAVSGSNLLFTITANKPVGNATILVKSGYGTGKLKDSKGNTGVIFNAADSLPYTLHKNIVRSTNSKSLAFPAPTYTATGLVVGGNFVGTTLVNTEAGYNSLINPQPPAIPLLKNDDITLSGFSLLMGSNWGAGTADNGETSVDFPVNVTKRSSAGNAASFAILTLQGLNPAKAYDFNTLHSRSGTSGGTLTVAHEGLTTNSRTLDTQENDVAQTATYNVMKSVKIRPTSGGEIVVRMTRVTDPFYRINGFIITEYTIS